MSSSKTTKIKEIYISNEISEQKLNSMKFIINKKLDSLTQQPFRAKFKVTGKESIIFKTKGLDVIKQHSFEIIKKRLADKQPYKDGSQTPYKNHPVFVCQHATATCCRSCLRNWHNIPKNIELSKDNIDYIILVHELWFIRQNIM
jgi:L-lysine 2,3-aminomutase